MLRPCGLLAVLLASAPLAAWSQDVTLLPPVRVDRVLVDARILDPQGHELRGLRPSDLRVEIDGKPGHLESVEWISEATLPENPEAAAPAEGEGALGPRTEPSGRLVVFLLQKDFEPSRLGGLMQMQEYAADFVRGLTPHDHAAVLTLDLHLHLHLDFTSDRALLAESLRLALLRDEPSEIAPGPGPGPSLWLSLDRDAARRAASPEAGLEILGRALEKLPGAKSLIFFGWGLGRLEGGTVQMDPDYDGARRALARSRTAVFALDVSKADFHSLEVGLQQVAADTGGFYMRTHNFPVLAMDRLSGALSGHYVLALERPAGPRGSHRVAVDLVALKGTVLARTTYVD
jgi:VWFA-related protein